MAAFATLQARAADAGLFTVDVEVQGSGTVAVEPRTDHYSDGTVVTLTAAPARWYGFSNWSDGSMSNPRQVTVSEDVLLAAVFTNSVPLETTRYKTRQWDRSYGGENDDQLLFLLPGAGDGWILAGDSSSPASDGKTAAGCGSTDFWVLEVDRNGDRVWERSFGGEDRERLAFVQSAQDGTLLLGGFSNSGPGCTKEAGGFGAGDVWIIKLDGNGNKLWEQVLGGTGSEQFPVCRPTPDGGAIIGCYSDSGVSGDKTTPGFGGFDYWLVKLGSGGEKQWEQTVGGTGDDFLSCVVATSDGGFLAGGSSSSPDDGNKTSLHFGGFDFWVVKFDAGGGVQWDRSYGGTSDDILSFVEPRDNGVAVLAGYSNSSADGNRTAESFGDYDFWMVRVGPEGDPEWDLAFGGAGTEVLTTLLPTGTDGFLLGGYSESDSSGNKFTLGYGAADYWLVKVDEEGNRQWEQTYGGSAVDVLLSVRTSQDGGYLLGGYSESFRGGNKLMNGLGGADYWIIKTRADGSREWEQTLGGPGEDVLYTVQETREGDLICAGFSRSGIGSRKAAVEFGGLDYWVVKLVSLEVPVGMPLIFVDDQWVPSGRIIIGDLAEIKMESSDADGLIFYTLDGSLPDTNSASYAGPFTTSESVVVRALSLSADGSRSSLGDPVEVSVHPTYQLNVTPAGGGTITLDPWYGPYLSNSIVTVTAVPDPGWTLLGWVGGTFPLEDPFELTMDHDHTLEAVFGTPVYAVADVDGSARVDPDITLHPYGSHVRFTAFPNPGFYFSVWEGGIGLAGSINPVELPVTVGNFSLIARFSALGENEVSFVTPVVGSGTVSVDPQKEVYTKGETVTLTATPGPGQIFVGWNRDETGFDTPLTVELDRSKTIGASFMSPGFHVDASSLSPDGFRIKLVEVPGGNFQIDRSPDLINWFPVATVTNAPPLVEMLDSGIAPSGQRFYRFIPIP